MNRVVPKTVAADTQFPGASLELDISASALSHAIRALETRIGIGLLNRTNRSVTLTAAGEELQAALLTPFMTIREAVENLNRFRDAPAGRIRLNVPCGAATQVIVSRKEIAPPRANRPISR